MQYFQQVGPLVFKTIISSDAEIRDRQAEIQSAAEQTIKQVNRSVLEQTARRVSAAMTHLQASSDFQSKLQQLQSLAHDWQTTADRNTKVSITRRMRATAQSVEDILRGSNDPQLHVDYSMSSDRIAEQADVLQNQRYLTQLFAFADMYVSKKYRLGSREAFYFQRSITNYLLAQHGSVAQHYQVVQEFADLMTSTTVYADRRDLDEFSEIKNDLPDLPSLIRSIDDVIQSGCQTQLIQNIEAADQWVYCPDVRLSHAPIN